MRLYAFIVGWLLASITYAQHTDTLPLPAMGETSVLQPIPSWGEQFATRMQQLMQDDFLDYTTLGLCIYDLTADSLVYAHGANRVMRPASTMKVITSVVALSTLGVAYRYSTTLHYTGSVMGDTLQGDLYVVGGMDPLFEHDDMQAFVAGLQRQGIRHISGRLVADHSLKDTTTWGEGWCWDDDNPALTPLLYQGRDRFITQFQRKLSEAGITFSGEVATGLCPAEATLVDIRHHSIHEVLRPVLKQSKNLHAETLFYNIGAKAGQRHAKGSVAQKRISTFLRQLGDYSDRNFRVADGSGLSLYNYVTPRLLVDVLRYAHQRTDIDEALTAALPIAGVDGTLSKRMVGTSAHRRIKAKTGTLEGVISLAGYAEATNGHRLAFALITNGTLSASTARRFHDKICIAMTE